MTSITMASRCFDNLLPPGAQEQREADYLCLTVTYVIMYHRDGSTVNTTGVPSTPRAGQNRLALIRLPHLVGGPRSCPLPSQHSWCWWETSSGFHYSSVKWRRKEGSLA